VLTLQRLHLNQTVEGPLQTGIEGLTVAEGNSYINHSSYGSHKADLTLATTIQLDEKTRDELFKVVASLQSKLGRRVSFDEAIMTLIQETRGVAVARKGFEGLFGSLRGDQEAWRELEALRARETRRLERIARSAR